MEVLVFHVESIQLKIECRRCGEAEIDRKEGYQWLDAKYDNRADKSTCKKSAIIGAKVARMS